MCNKEDYSFKLLFLAENTDFQTNFLQSAPNWHLAISTTNAEDTLDKARD